MRTRSTCSESAKAEQVVNEVEREKGAPLSNLNEDENIDPKETTEMSPDHCRPKLIGNDANNNEVRNDEGVNPKNMEITDAPVVKEAEPTSAEEKLEKSEDVDIGDLDNQTGQNLVDSSMEMDAEATENGSDTDKQVSEDDVHSQPESPEARKEDNDENKTKNNVQDSDSKEKSEGPEKTGFREGFLSFVPNPSSLLAGHMQTSFAKSLSAQFYNSLSSMMASQAMMKVKQEPKESTSFQSNEYSATTSSAKLMVPPRVESRSSDGSAQSYDGQYRNNATTSQHSISPAPSPGSEIVLHRPPSGMSPKSLAEQLRNNDSASMVVSRHQKFNAKNQVYMMPTNYPLSGGETSPPPMFPTLSTFQGPYPTMSELPIVSNQNTMTSSPTLHHFTTRYTIETPSDPSRLGVELVLEHDNDEPVIEVECGGNRGLLYVNKLCQGSKGQSIHFNEEWLTPNEFQFISGRETAKDWKRSIRHCGKSLKTLMTKGILQVHPPVCECGQCRGQHPSGQKLLSNKKPHQSSQKDTNNNKRLKNSPSFGATDSDHSTADTMTRHGFDGGLNSIISQLRKANGFDATEATETLDLSTKSHHKNGNISPSPDSRKRPRNDSSPDLRQRHTDDVVNGRSSSPLSKRPHSRHDDYTNTSYDKSSFAASYPFLSPEEQYRRMLELLKRSMSPSDQQRQLFNMAQNITDPLAMSRAGFGDFHALPNALQPESLFNDRKSKYKDEGNSHDLSRKSSKRHSDIPVRGPSLTSHREKYRKPDRRTPTHSSHRSEQKISHGESTHRSDPRTWPANRHSNMIDLNLNGSLANRMPDWIPKLPSWSAEPDQSTRKSSDLKLRSPRKNGSSRGYFQDNVILDRIPISKTPVTTLHHRPPTNFPVEDDIHHKHSVSDNHREKVRHPSAHDGNTKNTPMLDLQKHAVPMLSLKRPTKENLFSSERKLGNRLSNDSDHEMKEYNGEDTRRQSSSAPPPRLSSQQKGHTRKTSFGKFSSDRQTPPPAQNDNYLKQRNEEIEKSIDDMRKMTSEDVLKFIKEIDEDLEAHIEEFQKHNIDGEGLPFLNERHLMDIMDIKLGLALKIVSRVKRELKILPESVTGCHHSLFRHNEANLDEIATTINENIDETTKMPEKKSKMSEAGDEPYIDTNNNCENA